MFQFEVDEEIGQKSEENSGTSFKVGDRICVNDAFGEVKYVGEVAGYPGHWLGVEWDDKSRGKHDGSVGGKEYFASSNPTGASASFVKIRKAVKINGVVEALLERYQPTALPAIKSIEDRLDKKIISYEKLKVVNLGGRGIADLKGWQEFVKMCPNMEVLEISDNLIKDWEEIMEMCRCWSKLKRIDLSRNPLSFPTLEILENYKNCLDHLECIVLGGVSYEWDHFLQLSNFWRNLKELIVPYNKISIISPPQINTMIRITSLDLEKNQIKEWSEVLKLNCLKNLEYLNLCGNHISRINIPAPFDQQFPRLARLIIAENFIDNWESISELNKLMNLKELRIDINPILNHFNRPTNRQIIIARIEKLQKLEGVEIHRQERRDAELDYVKMYSKEWENVDQRNVFLQEHPIYPVLVEKHGQSAPSGKGDDNALKSPLLNLLIVPESALTYNECEKKILKTMTVHKLKNFLRRTFKLPPVPLTIVATSCRNSKITYELESDFMEVGQYSLEDGDILRLRW